MSQTKQVLMEHVSSDDILQLSMSIYKTLGESMTTETSSRLNLYRFFNIIILFTILIAIVANLFQVESGTSYIKTIEGSITITHALVKYFAFLYYKPDLIMLLNDVIHFWKTCDFKEAKILNRNIQRVYRYLKKGQNSFLTITCCIIISTMLRPVFSAESKFIFDCWVPDSFILETIILFFQYYFMTIALVVFAFDSMYISYSTHVVIQLRLLKYKLRYSVVNADIANLYNCVKHHQFLLLIFERMNRMYFWLFLFHYFLTLITGCTQLYIILLGEADFIHLVSTTIYIVALLVEFGLWSFPVEEFVFELSDISNAIYMSNWYEGNKTVKRILLTIMMRAQRQKYMSAGGLMNMNIDTFGSVVRKIFSFYAVLRNLLND